MKNDILLKAAAGAKVDRPAVWLMRQAGRVLPGYRKLRESVKDFTQLVKTPELACEATLEPVHTLGVDAAIIFSDILVVPEAMGLPYRMIENKGPWFENTIDSAKDIDNLKDGTGSDWDYVLKAIRLVKKELNDQVPLIGFAGSPFTIFAYITEGTGSKTFSVAKRMLFSEPAMAHRLLQKITRTTIEYLKNQVREGADIIQIFDSWGGVLGYDTYNEFSLQNIAAICDELNKLVPVIVFPKGAFFAGAELNKLNCRAVSLDWTVNPEEARRVLKGKTLQGNLDPCMLYAGKKAITDAVNRMCDRFGKQSYIANLGHGLYPDTPADNVKYFVDAVKEYSR